MFQTNSLKNVGGVGFLVNDTNWAKWGFEIYAVQRSLILLNIHIYIFGNNIATQQLHSHFSDFWSIFGDRMANLRLIGFKIDLYIKVNVNAGQNKFEVHI